MGAHITAVSLHRRPRNSTARPQAPGCPTCTQMGAPVGGSLGAPGASVSSDKEGLRSVVARRGELRTCPSCQMPPKPPGSVRPQKGQALSFD